MTRINAVRSIAVRNTNEAHSITWGSAKWGKNTGALIFAAVLIVCSVTVGCSTSNNNDKPKPVTTSNPIPVTQTPSPSPIAPAPVTQAATKPTPKKVVPKKPATVNYTDQTYGLTFEYPRRYAIETGSAATELLASTPLAMNFVEPGGVALAAVELPETSFANTDFSSAFFNVSVHKGLNPDQCSEFAVPQPKVVATSTTPATSIEVSTANSASNETPSTQTASTQSASSETPSAQSTS